MPLITTKYYEDLSLINKNYGEMKPKYTEASKPKCINSDYSKYGVNSLRLEDLHISNVLNSVRLLQPNRDRL